MASQVLRAAAISVLAAWASGCADTQPAATAQSAPKTAKNGGAQAPPRAPAAAPAASLDAEIARAHALRMQGHFVEATHALGQLMLVAPEDSRVVAEYGKALVQEGGRGPDAVAFLERAVQLRANDWTLYSALGVAYDQVNDRIRAKAAYERALALNPNDPAVLNNFAVSRMMAGDYNGAQNMLTRARAAGGDSPKIADNLRRLARMRSNGATGKPPAQGEKPQPGTADAAQSDKMAMQRPPADSRAGPARAKAPRKVVARSTAKPGTGAPSAPSGVPQLRTDD